MVNIKKLHAEGIPFAIIQYFESLTIVKKETHKKYEILYIEEITKKVKGEIKLLTRVSCKVLNSDEINFFREIKNSMELVLDNRNGKIWEFRQFEKAATCIPFSLN